MPLRRYKTRAIRQLLMDVYNLEELRTLCFDEFRPVYDDYAEVKKSELVRHLIDYCGRKGLFERLLRYVEEEAPKKYAVYTGRLWAEAKEPVDTPGTPPQPTPSISPDVLTITKPFVMEFVRVPAGEFLRGSDPTKDEYARDEEQPQHALYLPEFYIGKYPVTNVQYRTFLQASGHRGRSEWQKGQFPQGGAAHPATYVAWHDAVTFCRWFSQESGYLIRLPSEAEWEKAARGPSTSSGLGRIYPWGNQPPTVELCNFNKNEGGTTPVGHYSPQGDSPYGAADMAGNIWEWCSTMMEGDRSKPRFKPYPYQVEDEWSEDYLSKMDVLRTLRGGSWDDFGHLLRCAARGRYFPPGSWSYFGMRVTASPI